MPFYVRRKLSLFNDKLLYTVFSKKTLTGIVGLTEGFNRLIFGDSDEADIVGKLGTETTEICSNRHKEND
jgi:hypothetical protein